MGNEMGNYNSSDQREEDKTKMGVKDVTGKVSLLPEIETFPETLSGLSSDEEKKTVVEDSVEISSENREREACLPEYSELTMKSSEFIDENGEEDHFTSSINEDKQVEPDLHEIRQETSEYQLETQVSTEKEEGKSVDLKLDKSQVERSLCNESTQETMDAFRLSSESVIQKSRFFIETENLNNLDENCSQNAETRKEDLSIQQEKLCDENKISSEDDGNNLTIKTTVEVLTLNGEFDGSPKEMNLDKNNSSESQPEAIFIDLKFHSHHDKVSESEPGENFSAVGNYMNGELVEEATADEIDALNSKSQLSDSINDKTEDEKLVSPDSDDSSNIQIESSENEQKLEVAKDIQIDKRDSLSASNKQIQESEESNIQNDQFQTYLSTLGGEDYQHEEEKLEERKTEEIINMADGLKGEESCLSQPLPAFNEEALQFSQLESSVHQSDTSIKFQSVETKKESISELKQSPGKFSVLADLTFNCTNLTAEFPISEVHSAMEKETTQKEDDSIILAFAGCVQDEKELLERFSTESNSDTNSNSRTQMRKSPSFDINLRSSKLSEELDAIPLLCEEKSATEASMEKSVITMENPSREKSTASLSCFLEENKESQIAVATENQGDSSSAESTIPVGSRFFNGNGKAVSTPSEGRRNRKPRSSIFANCLCCAAAIN